MPGPLDGYRIVDLTSMLSGPWATMLLADQGADVIKVEVPGGGDHVRSLGNQRAGMSAMFLNINRNKRSLTLDLKGERGVALFKRLASNVGLGMRPNPPLNREEPHRDSADDAAARSAIEAGGPRGSQVPAASEGARGQHDGHGRSAPQSGQRDHIEIPAFLRKHG